MKYRLLELLRSPDTGKKLTLNIFRTSQNDYSTLKLKKNPACSHFCHLHNTKLPTKKKLNCKDCYKKEIVSGTLTDGENIYPIINGIPRLLPHRMQSELVPHHPKFFKKYKQNLNGFHFSKQKRKSSEKKIEQTLHSYSYQWQTFDAMIPEWRKYTKFFLQPYPLTFFDKKIVLDAGCGYGRAAYTVCESGAELIGFDLSEAVQSAYKNTRKLPHSHIVQASMYDLPFTKDFDFLYSIGVLQHTPNKDLSFKKLSELTKKGARLHVWVYGKRKWHYKIVYLLRSFTTKMPYKPLNVLCYILAILQFVFLLFPYRVLNSMKITKGIAKMIPYTAAAYYPFMHNHANWFDRLSVPETDEFTRERVYNWFSKEKFSDINIIKTPEVMGMCASGKK